MTVTNQQVALAVIDFLQLSVASKQVSEDYAELMEVAIDCIADAFSVNSVDAATISSDFGGKLLQQVLTANVLQTVHSAVGIEVSAEIRAAADELKVLGNRAMASREFPEAIAKYTEALEMDPNNVVYLLNRSAAYASNNESKKAIADAERAIELDPKSSKPYSRLGLAQFSLGQFENAMNLYKKGLDVEGSSKLDAMQRGYETSKQRYEEQLENSMAVESKEKESPATGGMPDFSKMFSGGGMPNFAELMNNPQLMQAAQQMMSNPDSLKSLMNNPAMKKLAQSMGMGGADGQGPDLSTLSNLMKQYGNEN